MHWFVVGYLEILLGLSIFWLFLLFLSSRYDIESKGFLVAPLILIYRTSKLNGMYSRLSRPKKFWNNVGDGSVFIALTLFFVFPIVLLINLGRLIVTDDISPIFTPNPIDIISLETIFLAILALIFSLILHELAHGIMATVEGVKIEKTGIVFVAAFLTAFVQLSQQTLGKLSSRPRMRIISFAVIFNLLLALIFIPLLAISPTLISPLYGSSEGALVVGITATSPGDDNNLVKGDVITEVQKIDSTLNTLIQRTVVNSASDLIAALRNIPAGETFNIIVNGELRSITGVDPPENSDLITGSYLGIKVYDFKPSKIGFLSPIFPYYLEVELTWLININIILGLFNLLVLPYTDGNKIFEELTSSIDQQKRFYLKRIVSVVTFILLLLNVIFTLFPS